MMWDTLCNASQLIEPFGPTLEKDMPSKGDFAIDFNSYCDTYKLIKCPHIVFANGNKENTEVVRVMDVDIDLSNWRAMLLACSVMNSKVVEIYVHGCRLTVQHIVDLTAALIKVGTIKAIKLQYIDFASISDEEAAYLDAFKALFTDATNLCSISIIHCGLTDSIGQAIATSLASNYCINGLNLSYNCFTDTTLRSLLLAVRYTCNLKYIVLRGNMLSGKDVASLLVPMLIGSESSAADDVAVKANLKSLGDKNKAIKEANKKRKKAGCAELSELASFPDMIRKVGGKNTFSNQSLALLDMAESESSAAAMDQFAKLLDASDAEVVASVALQWRVSAPSVASAEDMDATLVSKYERIIKLV